MHCGPLPFGHHIRDGFRIRESGLIRCDKSVPRLPRHLVELEMLRRRRMFLEADQLRVVLEQQGQFVPTNEELDRMSKAAGTAPCDRWVFILPFRGGKNIIAEVSLDEEREMEHLSTPSEVIDYLGIFRKDVAA
jgi:hypothetical protein